MLSPPAQSCSTTECQTCRLPLTILIPLRHTSRGWFGRFRSRMARRYGTRIVNTNMSYTSCSESMRTADAERVVIETLGFTRRSQLIVVQPPLCHSRTLAIPWVSLNRARQCDDDERQSFGRSHKTIQKQPPEPSSGQTPYQTYLVSRQHDLWHIERKCVGRRNWAGDKWVAHEIWRQ